MVVLRPERPAIVSYAADAGTTTAVADAAVRAPTPRSNHVCPAAAILHWGRLELLGVKCAGPKRTLLGHGEGA